ncbi:MAG: energy-coupling factor ABC transporter permease [Halieaceae bacterium]|uniref:energy-coupling factor ABC transporter permease n=1 Tax=Haliea alexandrii TaxID=2448162 RepID=UPI000F0B08A7|nr:energy-coupling factor ABC transporter permease [Haliea alexandrii]MCR9184292.1 energy-coupling factor ABC transporter permease [Halieaceae bacterium]
MTLSAQLIPAYLSLPLAVLMALTCAACLWSANWRAVRQVPSRGHLLFGGAIACLALWLISFTVIDGVRVHFLGVTALTLVVGWRFAILAGSAAVVAHTLAICQPMISLPVAWLLTVAVPATVSRWLVYQLRATRAQNLFIYMLGAGFGGGALSSLAVTVTAVGLLWLAGQAQLVTLALQNWPAALLVLFPEGFINGMIITAFTVYYPDLLKTFDDEHYFAG